MSTSAVETERPRAQNVVLTEDTLTVDLMDGRTISVPLAWYPRLQHGKPSERRKWRLIGEGEGIHWPDLDEGISVNNLLTGKHSGESLASFRHWIEARGVRRHVVWTPEEPSREESVGTPKSTSSRRDPLANVGPRSRKVKFED